MTEDHKSENDLQKALGYLRENRERFLRELQEFLRFPSISTLPEQRAAVADTAAYVARLLNAAGLEKVRILPTPGHPVIYGEWCRVPGAPTLLIYGHYDVQPVDPLDLWDTHPFQPTVRGDLLVARGATDDKGQVFMHFKAVEAWLRTVGTLPVNVKFLVEGEEEIASPHLRAVVEEQRELLRADYLVVSDTGMPSPDQPAISYGLRGLTYLQVKLRGPARDLHSGQFGGGVANPIMEAARLLAALVDDQGRVRVPGFYDQVVPPDPEERQRLRRVPFDEESFRIRTGVPRASGEQGYTTLERLWLRPTCDPNGIEGGFTGQGAKTVLPAEARFKVSFRLVPHQDPERISMLVREYLEAQCSPSVTLEVETLAGGRPMLISPSAPMLQAAARSLAVAFPQPPVFVREGGSIPIVADLQDVLKVEPVLMGFGLPDSKVHSPNETFHLGVFRKGMEALVRFLAAAGETNLTRE